MRRRALLAEDNAEAAEQLREALAGEGFEVLETASAKHAARMFDAEPVDLAVLDIGLPDGSGIELCRRIRSHASRGRTPVILLSGERSLESKAAGFKAGADQYLVKPIRIRELLLWVRSILSRQEEDWSGAGVIRAEGLVIDPARRSVSAADREVPELTSREFDLLYALARARPRTLSREDLLRKVWGGAGRPNALAARSNTLEVHVKNLRRKLGPAAGAHILTVRGVGYRFQ